MTCKLWSTKADGSPRPPLGPVKFITVHCTATPYAHDYTADQISAMDMARTDLRQAAYHYVILKDGTVENTVPENLKGAHVGNNNAGNIGISYIGGLGPDNKPADTRTPAQKKAMAKLLSDLKARHPGAVVLGHRDWSPDRNHDGKITPNEYIKACPCFDVKAWIAAGMPGI